MKCLRHLSESITERTFVRRETLVTNEIKVHQDEFIF